MEPLLKQTDTLLYGQTILKQQYLLLEMPEQWKANFERNERKQEQKNEHDEFYLYPLSVRQFICHFPSLSVLGLKYYFLSDCFFRISHDHRHMLRGGMIRLVYGIM